MGMFIAMAIGVWIAALAIWYFLNNFLHNSDLGKIKNRLVGSQKKAEKAKKAGPALIEADEDKTKVLAKILHRFELGGKLRTLIEQSGLKWTAAKLVNSSIVAFGAGFGAGWVFLPGQFQSMAPVCGLVLGALPLLYLIRTRSSRIHKFEELFPDSLEFVARSMRAGHAFSVAMEMIHKEFQEPLGGEFRRVFEEHNLGLPLEVALEKLAQRIPLLDVHFFVSAVMLQKRTGGNLAEILDKLAYVIRERFKLRGRIKAISAHGRMTGTALTLIPVGVAVMMFWTNPDYIRFFFLDETGNYMMGTAILLQVIGYGVIQKIVTIEV